MLERRIRIVNPLGLHARAAAKLVKLVVMYQSRVGLSHNGSEADARSILSILALAAGYGTFVDLRIEGPDEEEAAVKIEQLIRGGFGEI